MIILDRGYAELGHLKTRFHVLNGIPENKKTVSPFFESVARPSWVLCRHYMPLRMRHHAQDLTRRVTDAGDILNGTGGIPWVAGFFAAFVYIFKDHLMIRCDFV